MTRRLMLVLLSVALLGVPACSEDPGSTLPTPAKSMADILRLETSALDWADIYWGSWPEVNEALERFSDDIVFYDAPDGDFEIAGAASLVPIFRGFIRWFADVEFDLGEVFLAEGSAAYVLAAAEGYWPPWSDEPDSHPPIVELAVIGFDGSEITSYDVWFDETTLRVTEMGCFAADCAEAAALVDGYFRAWTSGDRTRVAALYADDALFTDTILGLEARGPDRIAALAEARFGDEAPIWLRDGSTPATGPVITTGNRFFLTDGPRLVEPSEGVEERGEILAVGIEYSVSLGTDQLHALSLFELGTRRSDGFDLHPEGLITSEEVYYVADGYLVGK